jgi:hypothetical protein
MQACQGCGAIAVDAGGFCASCRPYRGPQSYALSPPAPDLPGPGRSDYGWPASSVAAAPVSDPGAVYYSTAGHASAVATYPVSPGGPADPQAAEGPVPTRSTGGPLTTPLFLLTVMVVVLVAGTVSVVLIRSAERGKPPAGNAAQSSPAAAAAAGAPSGPPPSAAPTTSAVVDRCVVGDWAVTSWRVTHAGVELATEAGGIVRLLADGTGSWDFGSGVTLTGTVEDIEAEDLITGRIDFAFRTSGQSFSFLNIRSDVREVISRPGRNTVNRQLLIESAVAEYTCAGDAIRLKVGTWDVQMVRK